MSRHFTATSSSWSRCSNPSCLSSTELPARALGPSNLPDALCCFSHMADLSVLNDDASRRRAAAASLVRELIPLARAHGPAYARRRLDFLKSDAARTFKLDNHIKHVEVLAAVPESHTTLLTPVLRAKPVRTASGIAVVAVMSKPHRCPHIATTGAICVYCAGGPDSDFEYSTQSYTGYEPTSMRAIRARYDPHEQVRSRVEQLARIGHSVDKVEFVLMGGTFLSLDTSYRDYFVRNLHDALSGHVSANVAEAVRYGEHATTRCVGLTIETRPDYCHRPHLSAMLGYGCTRLEIGVQSVYEDVARDTSAGGGRLLCVGQGRGLQGRRAPYARPPQHGHRAGHRVVP